MLRKLMPLLSLLMISSFSYANTNLPFTGERIFNFEGGNDNNGLIKIQKDGATDIAMFGKRFSYTVYRGMYSDSMASDEDETYFKVIGDSIIKLDKNGNIAYGCEATPDYDLDVNLYERPCISKLYKD